MTLFVTYTPNLSALIEFLAANPDMEGVYLKDGAPKLSFDGQPTFKNGDHSIKMLMLDNSDPLTAAIDAGVIEVLATGTNSIDVWQDVIDNNNAKLLLARPRPLMPIYNDDDEATGDFWQIPEIPGVFAGE